MLALIGRGWVDATNASGHRRIDDPNDYVRLEITAALKRNIPVLPVLVQGVQMPAMEMLPEEMRDFTFRNAFELSHSRWDSDVHEMLKRLGLDNPQGAGSIPEAGAPVGKASTDGASTAVRGSAAEAGATRPPNRKPWLAIAAGTLAALALAAGGLLYMRTVAERDARIEQAKIEGARAKAAADAQLLASRVEAAKARADAEAASAAVAAAQAEKEIAAARARKEIEAAVLAERNRAVAQVAKDRETAAQAHKPVTPAQPTRQKSATAASAPTSDVQTLLKTAKALERGDGVARDYAEAARLYRIAAEQGNAVA
jgi:hypothetical protein